MRRKIGYPVEPDTLTFAKVHIGQFFICDEDIWFKFDGDQACIVASDDSDAIGNYFDFYDGDIVDEIIANLEIV